MIKAKKSNGRPSASYKVIDVKKTKRFSIVIESLEKDDENHFVFERKTPVGVGKVDLSQYPTASPTSSAMSSESDYEDDSSVSSVRLFSVFALLCTNRR